jgi:hypothetical protein
MQNGEQVNCRKGFCVGRLPIFCFALTMLVAAGCDASGADRAAIELAAVPPATPKTEPPSELLEIAKIRRDVYAATDIASINELLVEGYPRSLEELQSDFEANAGGVWCWGASYALQLTLKQRGYQSYTLSYGFPQEGLLTHAVTLVNIGGEFYLQDATLNYDYAIPFFDLVRELASGRAPAVNVQGGLRDVHVLEVGKDASWAVTPGADCVRSEARDGVLVCRSEANLTLFNERYMSRDGQATLDKLGALGRPRELAFLMLYPYEIFDGTGTYGKEHPLIRKMTQIIGMQP